VDVGPHGQLVRRTRRELQGREIDIGVMTEIRGARLALRGRARLDVGLRGAGEPRDDVPEEKKRQQARKAAHGPA